MTDAHVQAHHGDVTTVDAPSDAAIPSPAAPDGQLSPSPLPRILLAAGVAGLLMLDRRPGLRPRRRAQARRWAAVGRFRYRVGAADRPVPARRGRHRHGRLPAPGGCPAARPQGRARVPQRGRRSGWRGRRRGVWLLTVLVEALLSLSQEAGVPLSQLHCEQHQLLRHQRDRRGDLPRRRDRRAADRAHPGHLAGQYSGRPARCRDRRALLCRRCSPATPPAPATMTPPCPASPSTSSPPACGSAAWSPSAGSPCRQGPEVARDRAAAVLDAGARLLRDGGPQRAAERLHPDRLLLRPRYPLRRAGDREERGADRARASSATATVDARCRQQRRATGGRSSGSPASRSLSWRIAVGLAVALSKSPTPQPRSVPDTSAAKAVLGYDLPPPISVGHLAFDWAPQVFFAVLPGRRGVLVRAGSVHRLHARGDSWPRLYTAAWYAGLVVVLHHHADRGQPLRRDHVQRPHGPAHAAVDGRAAAAGARGPDHARVALPADQGAAAGRAGRAGLVARDPAQPDRPACSRTRWWRWASSSPARSACTSRACSPT